MEIKRLGLLGRHIGYTLSPDIHRRLSLRYGIVVSYEVLDATEDQLPDLLQQHWDGLNVTVPYKQKIIRYLDKLSPVARETGSVNTIAPGPGGLTGYNTDVFGFEFLLMQTGIIPGRRDYRALVLGYGGAARSVIRVLESYGIAYTVVNRRRRLPGMLSYGQLEPAHIRAHRLVINTTPLGGPNYPRQAPPIPYGYLTREHILVDLNYRPRPTGFLRLGRHFGARTYDGFPMLVAQARKAWQIWFEAGH